MTHRNVKDAVAVCAQEAYAAAIAHGSKGACASTHIDAEVRVVVAMAFVAPGEQAMDALHEMVERLTEQVREHPPEEPHVH